MSDFKFSCPSCQQHIQADHGYAGLQINCPACNAPIIVPGAVATPPAPVLSAAEAPPPPPPRPGPVAGGCPSCGNPLPRGAVICIKCGYNLATKQRTVAGRVVPMGAAMAPSGEVPWYKTAWPYIGVLVLLLGALYYGGKTNPVLMLVFIGVLALYCVGVHILAVIAAFQEGAGTGFMTLCIPFYAIYYVFKVSENSTLQALYSAAVVINIILRFLPLKD